MPYRVLRAMASSQFDDKPLYEPLDTIRLLRLPWGKDSSGFDGYMVSFALNSASCPNFVALSYTWSEAEVRPPPRSHSINLNGHEFIVLDSLYPFLKLAPNLPEFSADTWWWIDSICINQECEEEKSSQMQIMGTIYRRAFNTVVWLGEEVGDNFSKETRNCTGSIDSLYEFCDTLDAATREDGSVDKAKMNTLREPGSWVGRWDAVDRLLMRPWWRRVWTLQELLISSHLTFYCGEKHISRRSLHDAVYAMWVCKGWDGHIMSKKAFYGAWNRRRMHQWYKKRRNEMGLVATMAYVGDCAATDERDRIYSLLGVARDAKLVGLLDPKSTVEEVYTKLVASFILEYNSLDIICYSHLFNNSGAGSNAKRLPSWVPDWRAHVEGKVIPVMACQGSKDSTGNFRPAWTFESKAMYEASGKKAPKIQISGDLKELTCGGIVLDKIDGIGGSAYNDTGKAQTEEEDLLLVETMSENNRRPDPRTNSTSDLMETISRCIALDREDRYLGDHIAPDHFRADFETFCRAMLDNPDAVPILFQEWFPINEGLCIRGRTLEEHVANLPKTSVTWRDFRDPDGLKKFHGRFEDTCVTMARRLAVTEKGHLGMAASRAKRGDLVCILFGCSVPVLLRERGEATYEFIGECFLDGFMSGEAVIQDRGVNAMQFAIV